MPQVLNEVLCNAVLFTQLGVTQGVNRLETTVLKAFEGTVKNAIVHADISRPTYQATKVLQEFAAQAEWPLHGGGSSLLPDTLRYQFLNPNSHT
jgi:hypothetical protein